MKVLISLLSIASSLEIAFAQSSKLSCIEQLTALMPHTYSVRPLPPRPLTPKGLAQNALTRVKRTLYLPYLHYRAQKPHSVSWDYARLAKTTEELYQQGTLPRSHIKKFLANPKLKSLNQYLEVASPSRTLLSHDYSLETKAKIIGQILDQVGHPAEWLEFFSTKKLLVEELQILEQQLTKPIPEKKIVLYQSYIDFAQSYRISNSSLTATATSKIFPKYRDNISTEALKYISQLERINHNDHSAVSFFSHFRWGSSFLEKFRRQLKKVDRYYEKTLAKEIKRLEKTNSQAKVKIDNSKLITTATSNALRQKKIYHSLYMGCRSMRKSSSHTTNLKRFTAFLILSSIAIDGAIYTHQTPDGKIKKFSDEYFKQIRQAMQTPRWKKVLGYELTLSAISSAISGLFIANPLASSLEKTATSLTAKTASGAAESTLFNYIFAPSKAYSNQLFNELVNHPDFPQFQNRIWEIVDQAGLTQEFHQALQNTITGGAAQHQKTPATLVQGIDAELYALLKGIDLQTATHEINQAMANPQTHQYVQELHSQLHPKKLAQPLRLTTNQLAQQIVAPLNKKFEPTALSPQSLLEERARDIFLAALTQTIYHAQAGALIQTGNVGLDRFAFYRFYGLFSSTKSIIIGMYIYRILCMGQGSLASILYAVSIKSAETVLSSDLHWSLRNCAIGKTKSPSFANIFYPSSIEKEDLCYGTFLKRERTLLFRSFQRTFSFNKALAARKYLEHLPE